MKILKNILGFIVNPKNFRAYILIIIIILIFILIKQCESISSAKNELTRLTNNIEASNDTIRNYKDKWGNSVGEIQGLTLTLDELKNSKDSIIITKRRPPITIIEYRTNIVEKFIEVPVFIKDTIIIQDGLEYDSSAIFAINDTFGLSNRNIAVMIPYSIDSTIMFGRANLDLEQNIWLRAAIYQDQKTKKVYVKLESDYPGVTFNNAHGILIDKNSKEFRNFNMKNRKSFGIGIHIGGGYDPLHNNFAPYIGIGVHYSPKFLQW